MIKNYFPIDQSKSLKKKILIQPLFVDQKVKNSKEICKMISQLWKLT